ncbi:hypoxia up-regulated protein 1 [Archocentrus centrarchus]|uniref:hypoxia up-regulated protein 1 n=1 Tax=Archocentrus centrarchus TaxID=63155 RepID=UPI0011E9F888|nr:hypoxia up-regulated protein 1 [Archocentrus centrarchus]XP_030601792.1 hypoxia up-regulated protein 1 [Archocentrus centrarchus]XP_030601793.1 hypoxia up-regulated protein 1 [Archocentrus centrarchus]
MSGRKLVLGALFYLVLAMLPSHIVTVAVMSVDLGSEWMKMAIVKPGVPMEIVLNKESRRKTPTVVCLKEGERLFGDSAMGVSVKNPKSVYRHLQSLLGKKYNNHQVDLYQKNFPEHQIQEDPVRGTIYFKNSEEMQYTPEELFGMVLNYSRGLAQDFAEQPIKDAVITVPAFFNQAERRAVLHAAHMAGLKVLQLINDNTAVALNYGVFRRKDIDGTAKNVLFYDMGSGSTTATIVTYQTVKTKESGTQPQLQIRGVGFDRGLGGFEMDLRLRNHLAKLFNEQKKSRKDVRENHRAMAKLLKEAQRLKTVLSANVDFMAQVEGLMDDIDFKAKVTRSEFEELCADLFERVPRPVQDALTAAEMKLEEIEQVILVGGSTRVPKVQEVLLKAVGKEELGKNINADEAAAMGAVYQAAALSKAFKVKPFLVRDAAVFPIQVEFTREMEEEEGVKTLKHNKRILFQRMAPYPQRKVITFNRYNDDFAFEINYGDLSFLSQEDLSVFGSLNLTTVKLSGVGSSFQKHTDAESKGIKAHFNMDESGVLLLDRVESVFETVMEEREEESTLTKLGNTISTLFGGGSSEPAPNVTEPVQDEEEVPPESGKDGKHEDSKDEGQKDKAAKEKDEDSGKNSGEEKKQEKTEEAGSKTEAREEKNTANSEAEKEAEKKARPQKKSKISEDITVELLINDILDPTADDLTSSKKKLQDLTDRDLAKQEREKTLNSLEAFIFETQDKLYQEDYQRVVTEEEQEQISAKLKEVSEWMDEDGYAATTKQLREKLSQLKTLCKDMFFRVEERRKWPDRLAALESLLNTSSFFLKSARLIPENDQIFTDVELNMLEKVINETMIWKNETIAEQEKRSPKERPVLLSKDIESKLALLDREVNYLLNKAKFAKPKAKAKNSTSTDKSSKTNSTAEEKAIPPIEESTETKSDTGSPEEMPPGDTPPTEEGTLLADSDSQSQPTEESTTTETLERAQPENHIEDEL